MNRLHGKTAVITGGATGIGRAAARRFIEEGAFVFLFGRRQEALDTAVAGLGPNARGVQGSVSDPADLDPDRKPRIEYVSHPPKPAAAGRCWDERTRIIPRFRAE